MSTTAPGPTAAGRALRTASLSVALMNPCYWPEVRRGAERFVRELANGLLQRGHRPRLITSHPGPPSTRVEDGMTVLRLWRPPDGRLRRRAYEDYLTHVPFSYLALRAGDDDVAQALAAPDALAAVRWSRRSGRPVVFSHMGIPTRRFLASRRRRAEMTFAACREADATTALSRAAADAFRDCLGMETRVIHPGTDLDAFKPSAAERAPAPTIFCAASLDVRYKRVDMLLRALPLVRRARPQAQLRLLAPSDPALAERLVRECDGLELIPNDAALLPGSYRQAWVSALPSRGEAFGLVLVESLASGTPVVGTDSGGIPEIVDRPEIGATFDGDEGTLARALLEVLELAEDPQTAAACRRHAERFSTRATAQAYEQLYRELIAEGRPRA